MTAKVFISQPMRGKSDEEILEKRREIKDYIQNMTHVMDIEIIDSFFRGAPSGANPLWFLGKSLELMSTADIVFFCKGWGDARGCKIEHEAATAYGLNVIYEK